MKRILLHLSLVKVCTTTAPSSPAFLETLAQLWSRRGALNQPGTVFELYIYIQMRRFCTKTPQKRGIATTPVSSASLDRGAEQSGCRAASRQPGDTESSSSARLYQYGWQRSANLVKSLLLFYPLLLPSTTSNKSISSNKNAACGSLDV